MNNGDHISKFTFKSTVHIEKKKDKLMRLVSNSERIIENKETKNQILPLNQALVSWVEHTLHSKNLTFSLQSLHLQ